MEKIILGIDPGTNVMGYGLIKVVGNKAEMLTMGVIDLRKAGDAYLKLGHIFKRVSAIIDTYLPDEMAIEAPFLLLNQSYEEQKLQPIEAQPREMKIGNPYVCWSILCVHNSYFLCNRTSQSLIGIIIFKSSVPQILSQPTEVLP